MTRRRLIFCALCVSLALVVPASVSATQYTVDSRVSAATYETHFLGLVPIRGTFTRLTGTMKFDPRRDVGEIDVLIDTLSLTANSARARNVARGPDFFNSEKFPSIQFRSTRLVFADAALVSVEGNLTLSGVTQPVTLQVSSMACEPASPSESAALVTCQARASVTVKRSTFGMRAWPHTLSDDVAITLQLVAQSAPPNKTGDPVMESPVVK